MDQQKRQNEEDVDSFSVIITHNQYCGPKNGHCKGKK